MRLLQMVHRDFVCKVVNVSLKHSKTYGMKPSTRSSEYVQNHARPSMKTSYEQKAHSPYRQPGPRRYGYTQKHYTGGLLPRLKSNEMVTAMPAYHPKDSWSRERALFGQNDYIDILGDGTVHPVDLIHGPPWLIGFRGNELQRLIRRMKFDGLRLQHEEPTKFYNMRKRMRYLFHKANYTRSKRH